MRVTLQRTTGSFESLGKKHAVTCREMTKVFGRSFSDGSHQL